MTDITLLYTIIGVLMSAVLYGLKIMFEKVNQTLPRDVIREMIADSHKARDVQIQLLYEQIIHVRDEVEDILREIRDYNNAKKG